MLMRRNCNKGSEIMGKNKGVINVFIGEDLHAELKIEAARRRLSLKDLVIEKLSKKGGQ
ncbi:MAG: toxin-antitoxin system HicB family antitoxin [Erysipelotrichia bacterium]|nr:toxin-antitoxin system HicB family antitoxin [Erysipelotrichia bacterium]